MRRLSVPAVLVVALVGLAVIGRGGGTAAQDGTPAAGMAGHPLVGAWLLNTDVDDPGSRPSTLASFSADGVYSQVDSSGDAGIGSWAATGPTTAEMTFHGLLPDEEGGGMVTVRAAIEVAADGQTLTATYTLEFVGPDGTGTGQYGPGHVTGTRIAVEAMGTPAGSLADLESQVGAGGATPEASPAT
jgi:hypothetical protein